MKIGGADALSLNIGETPVRTIARGNLSDSGLPDVDALTYFDQNNITDSTAKGQIDNLVKTLKTTGFGASKCWDLTSIFLLRSLQSGRTGVVTSLPTSLGGLSLTSSISGAPGSIQMEPDNSGCTFSGSPSNIIQLSCPPSIVGALHYGYVIYAQSSLANRRQLISTSSISVDLVLFASTSQATACIIPGDNPSGPTVTSTSGFNLIRASISFPNSGGSVLGVSKFSPPQNLTYLQFGGSIPYPKRNSSFELASFSGMTSPPCWQGKIAAVAIVVASSNQELVICQPLIAQALKTTVLSGLPDSESPNPPSSSPPTFPI